MADREINPHPPLYTSREEADAAGDSGCFLSTTQTRNIGSRLPHRSLPVLALRKSEVAEALGISDEAFDRTVRPTLASVSLGSIEVWPVSSIQDWLAEHALSPAGEVELRRSRK